MKQNKTHKILTGLALVCILTTTVIGTTMANFTSASKLEGQANVSVCNLKVTGEDLFKKKYISDVTELANNSIQSVESDNNVVAPGTKNEINLFVNGESELLLDAKYSVDVELTGDWQDSEGNFYCPIEFKMTKYVKGADPTILTVKGIEHSSKEALLAAIKNTLVCNFTYEPNTAYKNVVPVSVAWSWPFSTSEANNAKDTALINKPLNSPNSLKLVCNSQFTQID